MCIYGLHQESTILQSTWRISKNKQTYILTLQIIDKKLHKRNAHILVGALKKPIFHNNLVDIFSIYLGICLGNILILDDNLSQACTKPPFNATIFFKTIHNVAYENNYLLKTIFPYLENMYRCQFSTSIFIKLKPFGDIKSMNIHDLLYKKLFDPYEEKCDPSYCKMAKSSIMNEKIIFFIYLCLILKLLLNVLHNYMYFHGFLNKILL
jgi:hypothetical protein